MTAAVAIHSHVGMAESHRLQQDEGGKCISASLSRGRRSDTQHCSSLGSILAEDLAFRQGARANRSPKQLRARLPANTTPHFCGHADKENDPSLLPLSPKPPAPSPPRHVLSDITRSAVNTSPSALALLHARTNRTILAAHAPTLRKNVLGHQHRRQTLKRRNAISLSKEQAAQLAGSLSSLQARVKFGEDVEMRDGKDDSCAGRAGADQWMSTTGAHTVVPLQENLFLVTRTDGHGFACLASSV